MSGIDWVSHVGRALQDVLDALEAIPELDDFWYGWRRRSVSARTKVADHDDSHPPNEEETGALTKPTSQGAADEITESELEALDKIYAAWGVTHDRCDDALRALNNPYVWRTVHVKRYGQNFARIFISLTEISMWRVAMDKWAQDKVRFVGNVVNHLENAAEIREKNLERFRRKMGVVLRSIGGADGGGTD
jgi:hypothetical protein